VSTARSGPEWKPLRRASAHELVIEAVEEQIAAGALRVGDLLPPERELAARLGVSRAGVREAVRVLESQGVLRSRPGADGGTFVTPLPREALSRFLRLHLALSSFALADVVDARVVLERASAVRAASARAEEGMAAMRDAMALMEAPGVSREDFSTADTAFHSGLAQASGNAVSAALTVSIRTAVGGPVLAALRRSTSWEALSDQLRSEHRAVYEAVVAGEGERAADLVERHVRGAAADLHLDAATLGETPFR
jgi:GntR family transcriptional regulator, transcriptional repressor for pyruvate dehydrogenase complex